MVAAGLIMTVGSFLGETGLRSIGQYGPALALEILIFPGLILFAFGLIMGRYTTEGEEIAPPAPDPPE